MQYYAVRSYWIMYIYDMITTCIDCRKHNIEFDPAVLHETRYCKDVFCFCERRAEDSYDRLNQNPCSARGGAGAARRTISCLNLCAWNCYVVGAEGTGNLSNVFVRLRHTRPRPNLFIRPEAWARGSRLTPGSTTLTLDPLAHPWRRLLSTNIGQ